MTGRHIELKT